MAAYGTLVSLQNLLENIQLYHAHQPTFLDEHQKKVESLHKTVTNLQDLLEWCSNRRCSEAQPLESRILHAANGVEDIIELYIVDCIRVRSLKEQMMIDQDYPECFINAHDIDPGFFSEELEKVIEDMDLMEKEMMKVKEKNIDSEDKLLPYLLPSASLEYPPGEDNSMVGLEDESNAIMSKLMGYEENLEIISITGMGGSGKSTLARNVWDSKSSMEQFDVRGWIIISQEFRARETLYHLLKEFGIPQDDKDEFHALGDKLRKHLFGRRFLILVDDIWSVKDWEKLRTFLPDNKNGSRIVVTTRLVNVATDIGSSLICKINLLDESNSWSLLCRKAFPNQHCPPELQETGYRISKNCKGLPLSLAVIGGLLARLEKTQECWEKIAGETNMLITSEDDERCFKILSLSYSHLPIYLKPCFLYMGIFPEDGIIAADSLIDLWIAEGFIKSCVSSKSLEEVAQNYLQDLIQRSLIYVSKTVNPGVSHGLEEYVSWGDFRFARVAKMEHVRIHDLLRKLALKEAVISKFLHVTMFPDPDFSVRMNSERRVGFHSDRPYSFKTYNLHVKRFDTFQPTSEFIKTPKDSPEIEDALTTATFLRSLICNHPLEMPEQPNSRLLRVSMNLKCSAKSIFQVINSRNLHIRDSNSCRLSPVRFLWNLQVLFVENESLIRPDPDRPATLPIWEMPLLRKLFIDNFILPDLPKSEMDGNCDQVTNLQVISCILRFTCTEEVLRKISNIQKLHLTYADESEKGFSHYCLGNLDRLPNLQTVGFWFENQTELLQNLGFSQSLKIVYLGNCCFEWEVLTEKVGSLPLLEELSLYDCSTGKDWNLEEGFFLCLKVLRIRTCCHLVRWSTESKAFPCLEHLFLEEVEQLEEIPAEIGDTATLQSIHLKRCSSSIVASAKTILLEQLQYGNDGLRVLVTDWLQEEEIIGEEIEGEDDDDDDDDEEEEEVQGEEIGEEVGVERERDQEETVQQEEQEEEKKSRRFVAPFISFLVILGSSYVWHCNKFGGAYHKKKDSDRRRRETDDSWWLLYDYP